MMSQKQSLIEYKDDVATVAGLIGIISVLLYVSGYIAERIHWNSYGNVETPTDHIEFLYRGGNILLSSLAAFFLYLISSLLSFSIRLPLISAIFVSFLLTIYLLKTRSGNLKSSHLATIYLSLFLSFAFLAFLLVIEIIKWPDNNRDLLFQNHSASNPFFHDDFFQDYVGVSLLWLIFSIFCKRVIKILELKAGSDQVATTVEHSSLVNSVCRPLKWLTLTTRFTLIISIFLLILLPALYGSYQYPNTYPIVQVLLSKDAVSQLEKRITDAKSLALLYQAKDYYVFYAKFPEPIVLKIKISDVSGIIIHRVADIRDERSFTLERPRQTSEETNSGKTNQQVQK